MSTAGIVGTHFRHSLKGMVEDSLCVSGVARVARFRRGSDVLILAYHNVVPDGETAIGDSSLHLPQRTFARQMDALCATHDVIPLADALAPPSRWRPRAVVTFDDACAGAVSTGVEELVRRGLPATIFVAPAFVGGGAFWWDEIAYPPGGCVDAETREHCLTNLRGRASDILRWAESHGLARNEVPAHQRGAAEADLARATAHPGITLASHTWSHPNLAALKPAELEQELARPLAWLRERFECPLPWLSYPYGLHSPRVEAAAERAGYEGALRVEGGWLSKRAARVSRFALPRLNIPAGLSLPGFRLRAAGLLARS
jgi:peptidoglycan/xylan/chitin deacetylase (PgdA/CDA1 family)